MSWIMWGVLGFLGLIGLALVIAAIVAGTFLLVVFGGLSLKAAAILTVIGMAVTVSLAVWFTKPAESLTAWF